MATAKPKVEITFLTVIDGAAIPTSTPIFSAMPELDMLLSTLPDVTGKALNWLKSYLNERSSFVHYSNASSNTSLVEAGVPQGSALGPYLFSMYIAPLSNDVIRSFGITHHQYADDTQSQVARQGQPC